MTNDHDRSNARGFRNNYAIPNKAGRFKLAEKIVLLIDLDVGI